MPTSERPKYNEVQQVCFKHDSVVKSLHQAWMPSLNLFKCPQCVCFPYFCLCDLIWSGVFSLLWSIVWLWCGCSMERCKILDTSGHWMPQVARKLFHPFDRTLERCLGDARLEDALHKSLDPRVMIRNDACNANAMPMPLRTWDCASSRATKIQFALDWKGRASRMVRPLSLCCDIAIVES